MKSIEHPKSLPERTSDSSLETTSLVQIGDYRTFEHGPRCDTFTSRQVFVRGRVQLPNRVATHFSEVAFTIRVLQVRSANRCWLWEASNPVPWNSTHAPSADDSSAELKDRSLSDIEKL